MQKINRTVETVSELSEMRRNLKCLDIFEKKNLLSGCRGDPGHRQMEHRLRGGVPRYLPRNGHRRRGRGGQEIEEQPNLEKTYVKYQQLGRISIRFLDAALERVKIVSLTERRAKYIFSKILYDALCS